MPSLDLHHAVLRRQWPQLEEVWLFGSAATPQGLRRHSDLDLDLQVELGKLDWLVAAHLG
jgi:predicted nucleotidyltransferase